MFAKRIHRLRQIIEEAKLDALFVTNFYNILYLTGFKTLSPNEREAFVLVSSRKIYLFTDGRYFDNSEFIIQNSELQIRLIEPGKALIHHLKDTIRENRIINLGFEAEDLKYLEYRQFKKGLSNVDLIPTERLTIKLRAIKDAVEIEKIKKACELTDLCLNQLVNNIRLGQSEKEIAYKIEFWIKSQRYDLAFDPIVAIDENSALPHYNTKDNQGEVRKKSLILIDFGVFFEDYLSDITRIFFYGQPSDQVLNVYDHLLQAQTAVVDQAGKYKRVAEIDHHCRRLLEENGLPIFPHSTGHGVGLEIHEYPKISSVSNEKILDNQVFTIEPGVYFPGKYGIRIEDLVWKKPEKLEVLTRFPKKPLFI